MTAPVLDTEPHVTPADLATWLRQDVDTDAAALTIAAAVLACHTAVDPIPSTCGPVVLAVAARVYSNPTSATTSAAGPFTIAWSGTGAYLTTTERATLLAAAGPPGRPGAGAFTIDPTPLLAWSAA